MILPQGFRSAKHRGRRRFPRASPRVIWLRPHLEDQRSSVDQVRVLKPRLVERLAFQRSGYIPGRNREHFSSRQPSAELGGLPGSGSEGIDTRQNVRPASTYFPLDSPSRRRHYFAMNWVSWAVLSAFFAGLTAILSKIGVTNVNSNLATAVRTIIIVACAWALALFTTNLKELGDFSKRTWAFLILSGLSTCVSWLCYFRALQLGEASRVAPVDKLSVVFTIGLAALFLGEPINWQQWTGGRLIFIGAIVLAIG